jgi:hypothetical protein
MEDHRHKAVEASGEGLRTASSLRFVFTRRQTEVKTVEINKPRVVQPNTKDPQKPENGNGDFLNAKVKKTPGRKQSVGVSAKNKNDQATEEIKRLKLEWGKSYKAMSEGNTPQFPIFMEFTKTADCQADPFYLKIFREMAYGSFPKGIFYDNNRETIVCTEPPSKKNATTRRQRMEKYIRVCLPLRPEVADMDSKTFVTNPNVCTRDLEQPLTMNTDTGDKGDDSADQDQRRVNDIEIDNEQLDENEHYRRAIRFIYRSYQRLELPIAILREKYKMTFDRIYQEVKLFIFMMIEMTSPKDSVLLQEDSYQMILTGELISSLRPQKSWKRLNVVEQVSLICQYCKRCMVRNEGKPINQLSLYHQRLLRDIEDYVTGMYQIGCIRPSVIVFDGNSVTDIKGIVIHSRGVEIDREVLFDGFKTPEEPETIAPVIFQKYKTVSLQKIANGIDKQHSKISKLINDLAGESEYL